MAWASGGVGGFVSPTESKFWGEGFVCLRKTNTEGRDGGRGDYEKQSLGGGVCFSHGKQTLRGGTVCCLTKNKVWEVYWLNAKKESKYCTTNN